ncbi:acyltransferase family protein [Massilia sp. DWR3-1-1]|uniref:acyltransferase family protein n=1 Tax=Massilia sp. DWR3-1-1 TaxID=2804559 RepID=UPI003CF9376C
MNYPTPLAVICLTILAFFSVALMAKWDRSEDAAASRFMSIDGLRGYLAFFVFVHHAAVWLIYSHTGLWQLPPSYLYTQLGQSSVSLFFMITSFLFYTKLLDSRGQNYDWNAFFIGRFFRLTPLYFFAIGVLFLFVAILSKGIWHDSFRYVLRCLLEWITFTLVRAPDINQIPAHLIVAGVTWSLPYEWMFYFSLPLFAVTAGQRVKWRLLLMATAMLLLSVVLHMSLHMAFVFAGGIFSALIVRNQRFCGLARTKTGSTLALVALLSVTAFPTAYEWLPLALLTLAFSLIAGGASLFGLLTNNTSRRLGELAYSIYLLHGILLFLVINWLVGRSAVITMSPLQFWMLIGVVVPPLLGIATLTFRYIEKPGITLAKKVLALRSSWRNAIHGQHFT